MEETQYLNVCRQYQYQKFKQQKTLSLPTCHLHCLSYVCQLKVHCNLQTESVYGLFNENLKLAKNPSPWLKKDKSRREESQKVRKSDCQSVRQSESQTVRESHIQTVRQSESLTLRESDSLKVMYADTVTARQSDCQIHKQIVKRKYFPILVTQKLPYILGKH